MTTIVYHQRRLYTDGRHYTGVLYNYDAGRDQEKFQILEINGETVAVAKTGLSFNTAQLQWVKEILAKAMTTPLEELEDEMHKTYPYKRAPHVRFFALFRNAAFFVEIKKADGVAVKRLEESTFETIGSAAEEAVALWRVWNVPVDRIMEAVSKFDTLTSPVTHILEQDSLTGEAA
jgi:hypothetical protein